MGRNFPGKYEEKGKKLRKCRTNYTEKILEISFLIKKKICGDLDDISGKFDRYKRKFQRCLERNLRKIRGKLQKNENWKQYQ